MKSIKMLVLLLLLVLVLPSAAMAQQEPGTTGANDDPHQWLKDQQKKGTIPQGDPARLGDIELLERHRKKEASAEGNTSTGTPSSSTSTSTETATSGGSPVDNIVKSSIGSVDETYRGNTKWFKDDYVGNFFVNIGKGDPLSLGILGVFVAAGAGIWLKTRKKPENKSGSDANDENQ